MKYFSSGISVAVTSSLNIQERKVLAQLIIGYVLEGDVKLIPLY
jgi:hypothetical protein